MKKKLSEIDTNFAVPKEADAPGCVFHSVKAAPFRLYGLCLSENGAFCRMPESAAKSVSPETLELSYHTAGGRVRFKTDSEYVAIKCKMPARDLSSRMPDTGSSGFDMYIVRDGEESFVNMFVPPEKDEGGYFSVFHFGTSEMRELIINFPLYSGVYELLVGVFKDAALLSGGEYRHSLPVVFYGSSITQGGCASRPGNCYTALISQMCGCDHINLGFSGSAKGEDAMINYISSLRMSALVYDYDHNAPDAAHLKKTHERGFLRIRKAQPALPVIFVSAPLCEFGLPKEDFALRREIVFNTYKNAVAAGDKNVYYADGAALFNGFFKNSCTVDGIHPNDMGFLRMAEQIGKLVKAALK